MPEFIFGAFLVLVGFAAGAIFAWIVFLFGFWIGAHEWERRTREKLG